MLVVGTSMVQYVAVSGVQTFCYPGACVKDITTSALQQINNYTAGTNDIKYQQSETLKEEFIDLVDSVLDTGYCLSRDNSFVDNFAAFYFGLNRKGHVSYPPTIN